MDKKIKAVALAAAKAAGRELLSEFKTFKRRSVRFKSYTQIVTPADRKAERIILGTIKKDFPDHHILSEESGDNGKKSDYFWVIDPLDGTTNFSFHYPIWSVSIGLAFKGEMVLAVIYVPAQDELFVAEKGKGSFLNGRRIKVSSSGVRPVYTYCHGGLARDVKKAVEYYKIQKLKDFDIRQLGSAAYELAYVAAGRTDSIVIPGAKKWDAAAGVLLVKEAGGKVTDFSGKEWSLNSPDMLASNGQVHQAVLKTLKKIKV